MRRLPDQPRPHLGGVAVRLAELLQHGHGGVDVAVEQRGDRRRHLQAVGVGHRVDPGSRGQAIWAWWAARWWSPTDIASWPSSAWTEARRYGGSGPTVSADSA